MAKWLVLDDFEAPPVQLMAGSVIADTEYSIAKLVSQGCAIAPKLPGMDAVLALYKSTRRKRASFTSLHALLTSYGFLRELTITRTAAQPLSALRVLSPLGDQATYAQPCVGAAWPLGVSRNAALSGELVEIVASGELEDASWTWLPCRPVLLGADGLLTQSLTAEAVALVIAQALSATRIMVRMGHPITLAN